VTCEKEKEEREGDRERERVMKNARNCDPLAAATAAGVYRRIGQRD
jgi:hypothetical protein